MAYEFKLPDLGEGLTEAEIVEWLVKEGQTVKEHDPIVKVETAKAIVEVPTPVSGTILKIYRKVGETVQVGEVITAIGKKGEKALPPPTRAKGEAKLGVIGKLEQAQGVWQPPAPGKAAPAQARVLATPAVRNLAKKLGVDIETVKGTGPEGRVTDDDVISAAKISQAGAPSTYITTPAAKKVRKYDFYGFVDRQPLKGIRKVTADHLIVAKKAVPVTIMDEADVTALWEFRENEKGKAQEEGVHLTFLPFLMKASLDAFKEYPWFNAEFDDEAQEFVIKKYYNFGVAVDTPEGLLVPVVKGVDQKGILDLAREIEELVNSVNKRTLDLADLRGSSFTVTNIGAIGGRFATPVLNYPDTAILLTGKIYDAPVVRDGKIVVRKLLPLSLTFDHRVNDGAGAQRLLNEIKSLLEDEKWIELWKI
jgi:pyruvate dehydrogenase E2 component (dihydrolipoamide acetyltransferase)